MIKIETIDRIIKNDTSTLTKEVVDKIIENLEKNREQYLYAIDFLNDTNCMRKNTKQYKERKRIIDLNQETFDNVIQLDKKIFGNSSNVKLSIKNFISMTYDEITNDILLKKYISKPSKFDFRWQLMDEICQYSAAAKKDFPKKSLWSLIFNYDEISNKPINSISVRNHLMNLVNIDVCPYCNRLYITKWKNSIGKYKSTADLDHFFIKKSYPIFALSFFNFIPSCGVCNSRMKGDRFLSKDKHHTPPLYPGKAGFDSDAYFDISESAEDILNLIFKKEDIE